MANEVYGPDRKLSHSFSNDNLKRISEFLTSDIVNKFVAFLFPDVEMDSKLEK